MSFVPRPEIVTRVEWGCPECIAIPEYTEVTHLIIHHTAMTREDAHWKELLREIWELHVTTRGWNDIGYNFLIDPDGVIYEGRAGGDDVRGAHFICANENTMGVSLIGDFEVEGPSEAAVASLVALLAWKCDQRGIEPIGSTFHDATGLWLRNISGHLDGNDASPEAGACPVGTLCPGRHLYELMASIREQVQIEVVRKREIG